MKEKVLLYLYKQLKKKRIALGNAERKPNRIDSEIEDIQNAIEVLEYLTDLVLNDTSEGEKK